MICLSIDTSSVFLISWLGLRLRGEARPAADWDRLSLAFSLSLGHLMPSFVCSKKSPDLEVIRLKSPIYTSQIQEVGEHIRMPMHLFLLHFHCQAISFRLVIGLVFQIESKPRRQDKNEKALWQLQIWNGGTEWLQERASPSSERLFYRFCTGTFFLAGQSTLHQR